MEYCNLLLVPQMHAFIFWLGGVSLITVQSLANSMCLFLQWVEKHNVDWHEVYAVSDSDKAQGWRFRFAIYRLR